MMRETSFEAYRDIRDSGLLSKRRFQVYEILYVYGPMTGGELFREMKKKYGMTVPTNSNVTTRLGELRERGSVRELGVRRCKVSGQTVILWDVTKNLPSEPVRMKRKKCVHCAGLGYIKEN